MAEPGRASIGLVNWRRSARCRPRKADG